ncbi:hypothetical protein MIR68_010594 [Amoeboaphelidium protococcarum]|nr:hypothetical protein MIR68_010594 [Amoeboaphelidium protococcarum]
MSYFYLNKSVNQASAVASAASYGKDCIITASGSVLRQFKYQLPGGSLEQTGEHVLSRHVLYIHCYGSNLYVLYKDFSMELLSMKDAFKVVQCASIKDNFAQPMCDPVFRSSGNLLLMMVYKRKLVVVDMSKKLKINTIDMRLPIVHDFEYQNGRLYVLNQTLLHDFQMVTYVLDQKNFTIPEHGEVLAFSKVTTKFVAVIKDHVIVVSSGQLTVCTWNKIQFSLPFSECVYCSSVIKASDAAQILMVTRSGSVKLLRDFNDQRKAAIVNVDGHVPIGKFMIPLADDQSFFIASWVQDSSIIRLEEDLKAVQITSALVNVGPIIEQQLVLQNGSRPLLVASCNWGSPQHLAVMSYGSQVKEVAQIDLEYLQSAYSLIDPETKESQYLVLSFIEETKFIRLDVEGFESGEASLEVVDIDGFQSQKSSTLSAKSFADGQLWVQVTSECMVVVSAVDKRLRFIWYADQGAQIMHACGNETNLALALSDGRILIFHIQPDKYHLATSMDKGSQISSLSVHKNYMVISRWDRGLVELYNINDVSQPVWRKEFGDQQVVRHSILCQLKEEGPVLCFLSLNDTVYQYQLNLESYQLEQEKALKFDSGAVKFAAIEQGVVAYGSSSSVLIQCQDDKLSYSRLNYDPIHAICNFSNKIYPGASFMYTQKTSADAIDAQTIENDTSPPVSVGSGVITCIQSGSDQLNIQRYTVEYDVISSVCPQNSPFQFIITMCGKLVVLDYVNGGKVVCSHQFADSQVLDCVSVIKEAAAGEVLIAVGTEVSQVEQHLLESSFGHIYVVQFKTQKLSVVSSLKVNGAVRCLRAINDQRLVAGVNSRLLLIEIAAQSGKQESITMKTIGQYKGSSMIINLDICQSEYVLVGDMIKSVTILKYNQEKDTLDLVAQDYNKLWTTCCVFLDASNVCVATEDGMIIFMELEQDSATKKNNLVYKSAFMTGEVINTLQAGSLGSNFTASMEQPVAAAASDEKSAQPPRSVIYSCASGAIGELRSLDSDQYSLLSMLCLCLVKNKFADPGQQLPQEFIKLMKYGIDELTGIVDLLTLKQFQSLAVKQKEKIVKEINQMRTKKYLPSSVTLQQVESALQQVADL